MTTVVGGTGMGGGAEAGFRQAFLEGIGLTSMDLDRRLRYLSQNSAFKLEAISYSSSSCSLLMIRCTTQSTPTSDSLLENEKDEEDGANEEDNDAGGGVLAL
ncbi:hypothetical protein PVL29_004632 [Vitis rotundifolia]|uniref:Uncharacterized protein n=1 Tax=Vitis rotundifolia TaxID=103349 RepID=A0AA39A8H9_VITRO|nr:hypothetical protein PVL29_004632 [Vitis rotundifolia]